MQHVWKIMAVAVLVVPIVRIVEHIKMGNAYVLYTLLGPSVRG